MIITANEIKIKGISFIDKILESVEELFISVRGKNKFVILTTEKYYQLKQLELDLAYLETQKDIKNGNFTTDLNFHFKEIEELEK
jgi:PHD/YefM family antitoxin component YafN of YafNO toxin-antitoxin module